MCGQSGWFSGPDFGGALGDERVLTELLARSPPIRMVILLSAAGLTARLIETFRSSQASVESRCRIFLSALAS